MKAILTALSVGLTAAIVVLALTTPKAEAVVVYDWSGLCGSGCAGQATAVLTLEDTYVPGTQVMGADFISFSYSSSSGSFDIPADAAFDGFSVASVLPVVSGAAHILLDIDGPGTLFDSQPGGDWLSLFTPAGISDLDLGDEHQWVLRTTDLTAPGPLSLLAIGLAGLALAGRRRSNAKA